VTDYGSDGGIAAALSLLARCQWPLLARLQQSDLTEPEFYSHVTVTVPVTVTMTVSLY
jgi:hypothetical protein